MGAGRKKGVPNRDRQEFITLIQKIGKPKELIKKLKELAYGVKCVKHSKNGKIVYERPPDTQAIMYMLDQAYGKAKQSVEIEGNVGISWEEMFGINSVD